MTRNRNHSEVAGRAVVVLLLLAAASPGLSQAAVDTPHLPVVGETSHTHAGNDIVSGTVDAARIDADIARDSEVVDIVLDGDGSGSTLDADLLDGRNLTDLSPGSDNILSVSSSCPVAAADALAARCWQTISAAIDAADPACASDCLPAAASTTNRYLITVGSGTYTEQVQMIAFVDIEGSGEGLTTITSATSPTLAGANNAELRSLTVENTGDGTAIQNSGSPTVERVTARASGGVNAVAVFNTGGAPILIQLTTVSTGDGVKNATATATIRNSVLGGADNGIENATSIASIVNTQITGGAFDDSAGTTFACVGAYDATFTELNANCQ